VHALPIRESTVPKTQIIAARSLFAQMYAIYVCMVPSTREYGFNGRLTRSDLC